MSQLVTHSGGCHCGAVSFEMDAPADIIAWDCNCSICCMKRNTHVVVPSSRFRLLLGDDKLSEYVFNTGVARHRFCSVCGVQAFYNPRSNPDGVAVTVWCLKPGTVRTLTVKEFDGQNWEKFIDQSGIRAHSKAEATVSG